MLSKLNYYLDYPVKFLFINSKGNSLISWSKVFDQNSYGHQGGNLVTLTAFAAKRNYDKQIRRYLGFGFIASFIPGTEAFIARTEYFSSLLELHKKNEETIEKIAYPKYAFVIQLTPFFFLEDFLCRFYEVTATVPSNILFIRKDSFIKLMSYLPIIFDILRVSEGAWYKDLVHSFLNPIRFISALLRFMHRSIDTLFELGAERGTEASIFRIILKGLSAAVFIPIRLITALAECAIDLALDFLNILDLLRFSYEVGEQLLETWDKEFLYVHSKEYDAIEKMNQIFNNECDAIEEMNEADHSQNYTLKTMSKQEKAQYTEDKRFLDLMTESGIINPDSMTDVEGNNLKLLHDQFNQWKKLREFGLFAKTEGIPQEVNNLISQNICDLAIYEEEERFWAEFGCINFPKMKS